MEILYSTKQKDIQINRKHGVSYAKIISYIALILITVIVFIPLLITLFAAFKTPVQIGEEFPLKPPTFTYWKNVIFAFEKGKISLGLRNSLTLVAITIVINTILGSMTAYCLNRFNFKFKKLVLALFLLGMVIPSYITEISRFGIIKKMGAYNTIAAPIIIYAAADLMQIYIYTQFVEKIPESLDESAMIDGCTYYGIFWRIIFPLLMPATATLAIIKAVDVINDMYTPYLYMPSGRLRTLTTTLMDFSSAMFGTWENLSAAVILVMLPTIIIYLIFQRYIFAGIVAGAVKE